MDHDKPNFSLDQFLEWRSPRFGVANPSRMDNPVWEWLIRTKLSAYQATQSMNGPDSFKAGPVWCFDRFGQTLTTLPDGRVVCIAGEHEDYYDPDFKIYNDVVVINSDGVIEIYGYPKEVFPPTDFHSATVINNKVIIVGSLGYIEDRRPGEIQVYSLDLNDFRVSSQTCLGNSPGWLHGHCAVLDEDGTSIRITHGKLYLGEDSPLIENIDDWRLSLEDWTWHRLTERKWVRWDIKRSDQQPNHLWQLRQALWYDQVDTTEVVLESFQNFRQELGGKYNEENLTLLENLYNPNLAHEDVPVNEDEYGIYRIQVDGVIVRYVEDTFSIQVTVEGEISKKMIEILKADLLEKFSRIENTDCTITML